MKRMRILLVCMMLVLFVQPALATDTKYSVPNTISQNYFRLMLKWDEIEGSTDQQALYAACLLSDTQNALEQEGFDLDQVSDIILLKLANMVFLNAYQNSDCWTLIYAGGDISVQLDKDAAGAQDPVGFVRMMVKQGIYQDYAVVTKGDLQRANEQIQMRSQLAEKGDMEINFRYADSVYASRCGFFGFTCQQKSSFVSAAGEYLSDPTWNSCAAFRNSGHAPVYTGPYSNGFAYGGKWGLVNTQGEMVLPMEYDDMPYGPYEGVYSVEKGGKRYYYDIATEKILVLDGYDYASYEVSEGLISVFRGTVNKYGSPDKGIWGFVDLQGNTVIEMEWENVSLWSEGFCVVTRNGKKGLLRRDGTLLVPCMFDDVTSVKNGYYVLNIGDDYMVMDVDGHEHWRFNGEYKHVGMEDYGYVSVYKTFDNDGALYRYDGMQVLASRWYDIRIWDEGIARVGEKNADGSKSYGVIDLNTGKMLAPLIWDNIKQGEYQMYTVERNKQFGYLDKDFNEVISVRYEKATEFNEEYAAVKQNGQWHIIDTTGTVVY